MAIDLDPRKLFYQGNPKIKATGVPINFTQHQLSEYKKCADDPIYFIENYVKIVNVDKGLIPFILYKFQKRMIHAFQNNRFVIAKVARQSGKSTLTVSYILWYALFHEHKAVALLANKASTARDILGRLQLAYEHLPSWLQQGAEVWNKGSIEFENGSTIIAAATGGSSIRGGSFNLIFMDEFAFVPNTQAEEFMFSVFPTISSGQTSKMFIVSTPNGLNHYYKAWVRANEGQSQYFPVEVEWNEIPGRDEAFRTQVIADHGEEYWEQEFNCSFLGSQNTLITPNKLGQLAPRVPISEQNSLSIINHPEQGHSYCISVDVSRGKGIDYSTFSVMDITSYPYMQVATYRNDEISPMMYPAEIMNVGLAYNEAEVLIELNDAGEEVANILLYELEYPNVISVPKKGGKFEIGIIQSKATKRLGCSTLKDLVENDKILIQDMETISELSTFVMKRKSYEADNGCHDDMVMTLVNFAWLTRQDYFKELTDQDLRAKLYEERLKRTEDSMLPFGFLSDGITDSGNTETQKEDQEFMDWLLKD